MKEPTTLTAYETDVLVGLLARAQLSTRSDTRTFNLVRRCSVIIRKAEGRRSRTPRTSRLLLDPEVINDIFNNS